MKKNKKYRVCIQQVNPTYVYVDAIGIEQAREIGYKKWRRQYSHSSVLSVEEIAVPDHL